MVVPQGTLLRMITLMVTNMEIELKPATDYERRRYYREEWSHKDIPDFVANTITSREFGFDMNGTGPNNRYNTYRDTLSLGRFMKHNPPFAAYVSVAYYKKPEKREGWQKAELVFDIDAKDIPIRTCDCPEGQVCDKCLDQAREIVLMITDVLKGDLGLRNINMVYSGRGYHIRVLDDDVMEASSDLRGDIVQYVVGAKIPEFYGGVSEKGMPFFVVPYGYPKNFTKWAKYTIMHLDKDSQLEDVSKSALKEVLKNRHLLKDDIWGLFRANVGPRRYPKIINGVSRLNMSLTDTKVSIDLKRILRLPSSLHSKVSMKSTLIKNIETFDPFDDAIPEFVYDRK